MKIIYIFGKKESGYHKSTLVSDDCHFHYVWHSQIKENLNRLEGTRPHLIINASEPFEALKLYQPIMAARYDAQIINLY